MSPRDDEGWQRLQHNDDTTACGTRPCVEAVGVAESWVVGFEAVLVPVA